MALSTMSNYIQEYCITKKVVNQNLNAGGAQRQSVCKGIKNIENEKIIELKISELNIDFHNHIQTTYEQRPLAFSNYYL